MNFAIVERQLDIQLPAKCLAAIARLGKLDDPHNFMRMITAPRRLLEVNLAIRKNPKKWLVTGLPWEVSGMQP